VLCARGRFKPLGVHPLCCGTLSQNKTTGRSRCKRKRPLSRPSPLARCAGTGDALDKNATGTSLPNSRNTATVAPWSGRTRLIPHGGDAGISDTPIHDLHRGPTGVIPLARKEDGVVWQELGALAVGQPILPELIPALLRDAYFAINTSYGQPAPRKTPRQRTVWEPIRGEQPGAEQQVTRTSFTLHHTHTATGLPFVRHAADTLRWLNAAYVDLDCYKLGLSVGDALGALVNLQDAGEIPPATMFARSGRGLWAFWFLVDAQNPKSGIRAVHGQTHEPLTSQRATDRALRLYARVQKALVTKLASLGADLGAVDGPRYAPVPGTRKTSGREPVLYWIQATEDGVPYFTLQSLAEGLGIPLTFRENPIIEAAFPSRPLDAPKNPRKQAAAAAGWRGRWLNVVRDLETLWALRGETYGDVESRHMAALYHAVALVRAGMDGREVNARVTRYWEASRTLRPQDPLSPHDLQSILKSARKKRRYTHLRRETYLTALRATPAERSYLVSIRPKTSPAPTTTRAHQPARRQAIIEAVTVRFRGTVPSTRVMADYLASIGIPAGSHVTVSRDYAALGYQTQAKPGRPPKLPL
jgi:hypothetical protein